MNKNKHLYLLGLLFLFAFLPNLVSQQNLPDLTISLVESPDSLFAGQVVSNSYRYANESNTAILQPFRNVLFLSKDTLIGEDDILIGERKLDDFPANGLEFFSVFAINNVIAKIPDDTPSGDYFLLFSTDTDNVIPEISEGNNLVSRPLRINRNTDLSLENLDFSIPKDSLIPGDSFTVTYDIIVKFEPSPATQLQYTLVPVLERQTNPVAFPPFDVPALPIGRHSFTKEFTIPLAAEYGFYASSLNIDMEGQIMEVEENNNQLNTRGRGFQIINQLEVISVSCPPEIPQSNGQLTFDITIKNTATHPSPPTQIGFFQQIISINSPDRSEPRYGITNIPSIPANETITVQLFAQLPETIRLPGEPNAGAIIKDYILSFSPSGQGIASIVDLFCRKSTSDLQLELNSNDLMYGLTETGNGVNLQLKVINNGPDIAYNIRASLPSRRIVGSFTNTTTSDNAQFVANFQTSGDFFTYLNIPKLEVGELATLDASYLFFTPDNPESVTQILGSSISSPSLVDNFLENNAASITYFREGTLNNSCETLVFGGGQNLITLDGLTSSSKVEIIGKNTDYQTIIICENDCNQTQTIPNLSKGEYIVKVNLFNGENYCYREEVVLVTEEIKPNNDGKADCDKLIFTTENQQIIVDGLTATNNKVEIIGRNTDWQVVTICDGDCSENQVIPNLQAGEYAIKINQSGADGSYCYREDKVVVDDEMSTGGSANCESLLFSSNNDSIFVNGLSAAYNKVEILGRNTNWQVVTICDGDCSEIQVIPNLRAGEYAVKINQSGLDESYCYREAQVIVGNSGDNRNSILEFNEDLLLYPNPAMDWINLRFPSFSEKKGIIRIYNAFGQLVHSFAKTPFEQEEILIDLEGFENGIYLVTVQMDKLPLISRRFVVEHLR